MTDKRNYEIMNYDDNDMVLWTRTLHSDLHRDTHL